MATERTPLIPKGPAEVPNSDFALLMTGIWRYVEVLVEVLVKPTLG